MIRRWLIDRFLPVWAKETVLTECKHLRERVAFLEQENAQLRAYASGLEYGARRKVIVKNEVMK